MPFSEDDYPALAAEITNDPEGYDYAILVEEDDYQGVADTINLARPGAEVDGGIAIKRADCTPIEVLEAIDVRDMLASPTGVTSVPMAASWLQSVTQFPTLRLLAEGGGKTLIRKNIDRLIGDTQGSQARLDAIAVRPGSRAEQLWGSGSRVEPWDVERALGMGA